MTFSEVLLQKRKSLGLSQEALADRLGVSRQAVSKWETGEAAPDLNKLIALSAALDLSLDTLCGLREELPAADSSPSPTKRRIPALIVLAAVLLIAGFAGGFSLGKNSIPAPPSAEPTTSLPETISVTGLNFSPETDGVTYQA